MTDIDQLQVIVNQQHGLVTFDQLEPCGFTRRRVEHMYSSGAWQRVLYGVYAVTTGPLSREMVLQAALLYGGAGAVLSHDTAAELWGMQRPDPEGPIHVTVRVGLSAVDQPATRVLSAARLNPNIGSILHPGVRVHRSRALPHIVVAASPPRTSPADTAIDLAVAQPTAQEAATTLAAVATNYGLRPDILMERARARPPRRYARSITRAIELLRDGVQSVLEYHYAVDVEKAHGLPSALRQSPVIVDGRVCYEDVEYIVGDLRLIVRLDGRRGHSLARDVFRDRRRENAAEMAGKRKLVFGWEEVRGAPCAVAAEVAAVLRRGGWSGPGTCLTCA
ncbi:hypothetical protein FOS14_15935 [Skermania sp. ID1734]|uniref:hypothetical protein n=1 Tax=Skermania sp. ID1734 TaxID=2597516 RepID=UPI00118118EB|nr:hypothetical protein [Skermania sp. ID1734]TSD96553.1 hypothetical protein FOS14_15935 [Skermania sp. ID1734]